jgi:hypothetical protein
VSLMLKLLAGWVALSVPVGVLLGRAFKLRERSAPALARDRSMPLGGPRPGSNPGRRLAS